MTLDPQTSFPGASRVPETLGYFATSASERRAVVAMPVADHATTLAGRLANMGVDAEPAGRGGAAVALAQQSADLEMMLVDMDIDGPGVRDVIYALRTNPATGQVPIGLLATSDRLDGRSSPGRASTSASSPSRDRKPMRRSTNWSRGSTQFRTATRSRPQAAPRWPASRSSGSANSWPATTRSTICIARPRSSKPRSTCRR